MYNTHIQNLHSRLIGSYYNSRTHHLCVLHDAIEREYGYLHSDLAALAPRNGKNNMNYFEVVQYIEGQVGL